jgi:hypothetical protein
MKKINYIIHGLLLITLSIVLSVPSAQAGNGTVTFKLLASDGTTGVSGATVLYFKSGGPQTLGTTDANGDFSQFINDIPNTTTFYIRPANGGVRTWTNIDPANNPTFTVQLKAVTIDLKSSTGSPLVGEAFYFGPSGLTSLGSTPVTFDLLPYTNLGTGQGNYDFRVAYQGRTSQTIRRDIDTNSIIDFNTTLVDINFGGTIQYYNSGGWQNFTSPMELIGGTQNFPNNTVSTAEFRFRVGTTTVYQQFLEITGTSVSRTLLRAINENNDPVEGMSFQPACGGSWLTAVIGQTNVNGYLLTELPSCLTKLQANISSTSQEQTLAQLGASNYTFTTQVLRVNLINHEGNPITDELGTIQRGGGWPTVGTFNSSGYIDVNTFPVNSISYRATYRFHTETKSFNISSGAGIQNVFFQTGKVVSMCGHTQISASGWRSFENGGEYLPGNRTFRNPSTTITVQAGKVNHLCPPFTGDSILLNPDINFTTLNKNVNGNVSTNDFSVGGTSYGVSPSLVSSPSGSTAIINMNSNGTYTFTADIIGEYIYNVEVCLPFPSTSCLTEVLTITVIDPYANNNNPLAVPVVGIVSGGSSPSTITLNVTSNDRVGNVFGGVSSTLNIPTLPNGTSSNRGGTLSVNTGGMIDYTPIANFFGNDTFVYSVCDANDGSLCKEEMVRIRVVNSNLSGVSISSDDLNYTYSGITVNADSALGVLTNDMSTLSTGLVATLVGGSTTSNPGESLLTIPGVGTIIMQSNGSYEFSPELSYVGTTVFPYRVSDGTSFSFASLNIIVNEIQVLPVNYSKFQVKCNENEISVEWETVSEQNNKYFEIFKTNENEWRSIGKVFGMGTTYQNSFYQFTDFEPTGPINIYKIKQVDYDGNTTFTKPIVSTCPMNEIKTNRVTFYPNPVSDIFHIKSDAVIEKLTITDINGKLLFDTELTSNHTELNLNQYIPGIYIVKVNGIPYKFIKN